MDLYKYIIIGGGIAGGRACQGIRKTDAAGSMALIAGENHVPYHRPPLSKGFLTGKEGLDRVYVKDDSFYAQNQVEVLKGKRAAQIDPQAHQVTLEDGRVLKYEKLLLATGGRAWRLPIPGSNLPGVLTLRTIEDAEAIRTMAQPGSHVLVLGGSFIGCEAAASLAQLGAHVTMVFPESRLLQLVAPQELSALLGDKYQANGVHIRTGTRPISLEGNQAVEHVVLENGETLKADLVVMGVGIRLNTELARQAGLEMGEKNAVVVDRFLRTSDPDIYAAGDIAAWPDRTFDKRLRVEHWDVAWRQGMRAGGNMAGETKPYTALPYFFSDLFDLSFEVWGDLTAWDQTVQRGKLESGSYAFYYFCQGRLVGVLSANRPDAERDLMDSLIKARPAYEDVRTRLEDEAIDLGTLVA